MVRLPGCKLDFKEPLVGMMKFRVAFAVLAMAVSAFGMSQKQKMTVRFHAETNPNDGENFTIKAKLANMRRDATLSSVPAINETQIKAIYPFPADDGSFGCVFQLDAQGRLRLETVSTEQRNTALVLYVATKQGHHQVIDMLIDRPVTNGIITVPRGLTQAEVAVMKTEFRVVGEVKGQKKPAPGEGGASAPAPAPASAPKPAAKPAPRTGPAPQPVPREQLRDLDLPRIAD